MNLKKAIQIPILVLLLFFSTVGFAQEQRVTRQEMQALVAALDGVQKAREEGALHNRTTLKGVKGPAAEYVPIAHLQEGENFLLALGRDPQRENHYTFLDIAQWMWAVFDDEKSFIDEAISLGNQEWNQREAIHYFLGGLSRVKPEYCKGVIERYTDKFGPPLAKEQLNLWEKRGRDFDSKVFLGTLSGDEKWVYAGDAGRDLLVLKAKILLDHGEFVRAVQLLELLIRTRTPLLQRSFEVEIRLLTAYAAAGEEENFKALAERIRQILQDGGLSESERETDLRILGRFVQGPCEKLLLQAKVKTQRREPKDFDFEMIGKLQSLKLTKLGAQRVAWLRIPDGGCGTSGSVEERIQNCATSRTSSKGFDWALVTRIPTHNIGVFKEVWKDTSSGLIWSDRLDWEMKHVDALKACSEEQSLDARGNITNVTWQLPSIDDYKLAKEHGIREVLPNLANHWFWSSSVHSDDRYFAWVFSGGSGNVVNYYRNNDNSVRCAGR